MTALVERVVWVSLATSLLLLPLLGLSGAIRRRYRAGSCYLLWLVLALRLLIPLPVPVPVGTALSQVVPAPAAIANAVSNALEQDYHDLPLRKEVILASLSK